jgi:tRNA(Ile)-lysidine synthase
MPPNPVPHVLSRVMGTIRCHAMIEPCSHIGVAVSGGIDSMVLLDILASLQAELHITLTILHLNHGIRGKEAARDQQFVQGLSAQYSLPYLGKEVDVPAYKKQKSLSLQEAARELRYLFFEQAMDTLDLDKVAIGQTADDQAETVLMRLIRGGGARGLKGIPPVRGRYIRPLIEVWREELLQYARHKGLSFVQDSSNLKMDYLRNRIRLELLPVLEGYNPGIKQRLLHLARVLGEDDSYLDGLAQEIAKGIVMKGEEVSLSIPSLLSLPLALQARVLQRAFAGLASGGILEYPHIEGVMTLIQGTGGSKRVSLPGGYWAMRSYDNLLMGREGETLEGMADETDLLIPGRTRLDKLGKELEASLAKGSPDPKADPPANPDTALLDYHRLALPLRVRTFRPGDSFVPLGMKGPKKLKNFFIDLKIPRAERLKIPLVISGNDICWVAGLRIDERFKILPDTGETLKLRLKRL